jgi:hypothetical protein
VYGPLFATRTQIPSFQVSFNVIKGTILAAQRRGLNSNWPMFDLVQVRYLSRICPSGQQMLCFSRY